MIEASAEGWSGHGRHIGARKQSLILSGPEPTEAEAIAAARHFALAKIGEPVSNLFEKWEVRSKEFRENLEWAVVVPGDAEVSQGVSQLLGELAQRGVTIRACVAGCW